MCTPSLVVVISFDRLPVSALSCYGGVSAQTPHIDRLAARGVVFDSHFLEDLGTDSPRHAWWTGRFEHTVSDQSSSVSLFELLTEQDVETRVFAHSQNAVFEWPDHEAIDRCVIEGGDVHTHAFHQGAEQLQRWCDTPSHSARLLWIHTQGYANSEQIETWGPFPSKCGLDVEMSQVLRQNLQDAQPWSEEQVEFWRELQRYRVTEFDRQIGTLCEQLKKYPAEATVIITSARGSLPTFSSLLPEYSAGLSTSHVHTPLIVSGASVSGAARRRELTQAVDLAPTLLKLLTSATCPQEWAGHSLNELIGSDGVDSANWPREAAYFGALREIRFGLRTVDFHLAVEGAGDEFWEDDAMLFRLPDDPNGVYDTARQEPAVVEELLQEYREFRESLKKTG